MQVLELFFAKNSLQLISKIPMVNDGYVLSAGSLAISSKNFTNNNKIFAFSRIDINADGNLINNAEINSKTAINVNANTVTNPGIMQSEGSLTINASSLNNSGTIFATNQLTEHITDEATNNGSMTSTGGAKIQARSLTNNGTLGARGLLALDLATDLRNNTKIEAGSIDIGIDGKIYNAGHDIVARSGDLKIHSRAGGRATEVDNEAGLLHSAGNMELHVTEVKNSRVGAQVNYINVEAAKASSYPVSKDWERISAKKERRTHQGEVKDQVVQQGTAARIQAGGNLNIDGHITNDASNITAGGSITGNQPTNSSIIVNQHVISYNSERENWKKPKRKVGIKSKVWGMKHIITDPVRVDPTTHVAIPMPQESLPAVVQAHGAIQMQAESALGSYNAPVLPNFVDNQVVPPASPSPAQLANPAAFAMPDITEVAVHYRKDHNNYQFASSIDNNAFEELVRNSAKRGISPESEVTKKPALLNVEIPQSAFDDPEIMALLQQSHWTAPAAPNQYYIKESSPLFTDLRLYHGTEDFIKRIPNYHPNRDVKIVGNSFEQMQLVQQQIARARGVVLLEGYKNPAIQMHALFDNAVRAHQQLALTPGISLTEAQVAALTEDMIWPEELIIDGQHVLTPRVYFAKNKAKAKFAGIKSDESIDLIAPEVVNRQTLEAPIVSLTATQGSVINIAAEIEGSKLTKIRAARDINNLSGTIGKSGETQLAAQNIRNITSSTRFGDESNGNYRDVIGSIAEIRGDKMVVQADNEYQSIGGKVSGGSLRLATETTTIMALKKASSMKSGGGNNFATAQTVEHLPSVTELTKELRIDNRGDFTLLGSIIRHGGGSVVDIGGKTHIASVKDMHYSHSRAKMGSAELFAERVNKESTSFKEDIVRAGFVGGDIAITSTGAEPQTYVAAILENATLRGAGAKFESLSSSDYSLINKDSRSAFWQSTKRSGADKETQNETILAGDSKVLTRTLAADYKDGGELKSKLDANEALRQMVVPDAEDISWNKVADKNTNLNYQHSGLTKEGGLALTAVVAIATAGAGAELGAAVANSVGASGATAAAITASTQSLVMGVSAQASMSVANNKGDLGAVLNELTSAKSFASLGKNALIAGATAGISEYTGVNKLATKQGFNRNTQFLAEGAVRGGVRAVFTNEKIGKIMEQEAVNALLSIAQYNAGEAGVKFGLAEGSAAKTAFHAGIGGAFSAAQGGNAAIGAIAGAAGEIVGGYAGANATSAELTTAKYKANAAATFIAAAAGGSAKEMARAGSIAGGVVENNLLQHLPKILKAAKEVTKITASKKTAEAITKTAVQKEVKTVIKEEGKEVLRGMRNPKVREAAAKGREKHKELQVKVKDKSKKGWLSEPTIIDSKTNKLLKPDVVTPSGRPIELKPNTPSGIKQGIKQIQKYEDSLGKKGKVIYYDP